ncbi:hypothetical protein EfmJHP36_25600 [Enterococcus faecium]|nr:hypothetical protein EfmJHP36_25600 [Enterococcus faecium]
MILSLFCLKFVIFISCFTQIAGDLTDNYNSGNKMLSLSQATAQSTSVAAIGVAAHECGHAVQDASGYVPLKIRAALVPAANFGSILLEQGINGELFIHMPCVTGKNKAGFHRNLSMLPSFFTGR